MPDTPLDWASIQTLDESALNLAIEAHCYHRTWRHITTPGKVAWWAYTAHGKEWGSGKGPPQHTASWESIMALSHTYGVWSERHCVGWSRWEGRRYQGWAVTMAVPYTNDEGERHHREMILHCETEQEEQVARCRLILYQAMHHQEKEPPHG